MTRVWLGCAVSLLFACSTGDVTDAPVVGGDDDEEEFDLLCSAELALTGTFTPEGSLDPELGCQPAGTWTIQASVSDMGSCDTINFESEYVYTVTVDPDTNEQTIVYQGDSTNVDTKVTANGSACAGTFRHISADGKELLNIRPYFEDSTEITGKAEYEVYPISQI